MKGTSSSLECSKKYNIALSHSSFIGVQSCKCTQSIFDAILNPEREKQNYLLLIMLFSFSQI